MNTDRASTLNTITSHTRVRVPARREAPGWLAPAGLVLLSLVPIVAGAARLTELTGGAQITAENARFFGSPIRDVVRQTISHLRSESGPAAMARSTSEHPRAKGPRRTPRSSSSSGTEILLDPRLL
jgi:hypothetical protein